MDLGDVVSLGNQLRVHLPRRTWCMWDGFMKTLVSSMKELCEGQQRIIADQQRIIADQRESLDISRAIIEEKKETMNGMQRINDTQASNIALLTERKEDMQETIDLFSERLKIAGDIEKKTKSLHRLRVYLKTKATRLDQQQEQLKMFFTGLETGSDFGCSEISEASTKGPPAWTPICSFDDVD